MVDRLFSDAELAALYDAFCERRDDFEFYLPLVMSAQAVLDVGCGTGALLHMARRAGHAGRLCGLDPAEGMLQQARKRADIEWVHGDLTSAAWKGEFDLVVMTGHAFQVFIADADLQTALVAIRSALTKNGRFAFETRNRLARGWESWTPENVHEITDSSGVVVQMVRQVETHDDGIVSFTHTFSSTKWESPRFSRSTLRFLDAKSLASILSGAGFVVEEQFGDWNRQPLSDTSPEIIIVARAG